MAYIPLGGDGFSSPFAAQAVRLMQASGDVSGTFLQMVVNLDPKFCGLVSYVTCQIAQGTSADADMRMVVASPEGEVLFQDVVPAVASDTSGLEVAHTFRPPAIILPGGGASNITVQFDNVDGDEYFLDAWVYLFNIRVRELTPIAPLLWAQGGAA